MKTALATLMFLLLSTAIISAAMAAEPPCKVVFDANHFGKCEFKGTDNITDTVVKLKMRGACPGDVTITRTAVSKKDIKDKCTNELWLSHSKPVWEKPGTGTGAKDKRQISIYTIDDNKTCTEKAFPAEVEISYFGDAPKAHGTEAFFTRFIHDTGGTCSDVTYEIEDSEDPNSDPKGGGGEGGFSDSFLVNLRDKSLPTNNRVDRGFHQLRTNVPSTAPGKFRSLILEAHFAFDAGVDYLQFGNLNDADKQFDLAKSKLSDFTTEVDGAPTTEIPRTKGNELHVQAYALLFAIDQFVDLNE